MSVSVGLVQVLLVPGHSFVALVHSVSRGAGYVSVSVGLVQVLLVPYHNFLAIDHSFPSSAGHSPSQCWTCPTAVGLGSYLSNNSVVLSGIWTYISQCWTCPSAVGSR